MTEDISTYTFDFETEVSLLRSNLPFGGKNIVFAETGVTQHNDANTPIEVRLLQVIGDQKFKTRYLPLIDEWVKWLFGKDPNASSQVSPPFVEKDGTVSHVIALREKEYGASMLGEESQALMRLFILYHETAHILVPGVSADNNHPFREAVADAYAALYFLQRFGPAAKNILSMISWSRTLKAVHEGETSHLTTTVLDKIIADSARRDFSKLSPAETIELAEAYAKEWTPSPAILSAARRFFKRTESFHYTLILQTCLASRSDFSFYIGAKFFQPFLQPQGLVLNGQPLKLPRKAQRDFAAAIAKRAAGMSLNNLVNTAASDASGPERPLTEFLKISRPQNKMPPRVTF